MNRKYDVIVVGAGHAGCEAALVAARMGSKTLLITLYLDTIALIPGSPARGGLEGKRFIERIKRLGGEMPRKVDQTLLWQKITQNGENSATLAVVDKGKYSLGMKHTLERQAGLRLKQDLVTGILLKKNKVFEIFTLLGQRFESKTAVLTPGSFLRGKTVFGTAVAPQGREGELTADELAQNLESIGFRFGRKKIEFAPTIDRKSLDLSQLEILASEPFRPPFASQKSSPPIQPSHCYLAETSKENRIFFLQPQKSGTRELYVGGLETDLGERKQLEILRATPGLEGAQIIRPGYAVEYNCLIPRQLKSSQETKLVEGLFMAGHVSGARRYEEAAAQGLIAGINAAMKSKGK